VTQPRSDPQAPNRTDGKTSVFLTDDPFPFDGVSRVDMHVVSIALALRADTSESAPPWVTVATPDRAFNLLDLQNGSTALLGDAVVPPGSYQAVRVVIDPDRSSITGAGGHPITRTETPGAPGRFTISFLRPGPYQIVAEDPVRKVESGIVTVQVRAGQTVDAGELRF
jgi:hypothetical protein